MSSEFKKKLLNLLKSLERKLDETDRRVLQAVVSQDFANLEHEKKKER